MPLPIPHLLEHLGLEWPLGHHCGGGSLEKTLHQPDPPLSNGPLERPALAQGSKNTDHLSQLLGTASISPGAQEKDIFKRNGFQAHRQVEQVPPRPLLTQRCSTLVWRPGAGLVDGYRAGRWDQGDYPWACVVPTRLWGTPGDAGRAGAWPEHSLALQPCLRAPSSILSQVRDTRQGLGEGCSPGPQVPPPAFSSCLFQHHSPPGRSTGRMPCPLNGGQE